MKSSDRKPRLTLAAGESPFHGADVRPARERASRDLDWSILMARSQAGDRLAYRRLLEDVAPYLRALALERLHDRGDAEDAVQDALLTVHALRHTYDPARPFGPWLVTIARRRIIDVLRRRGRARSRETALDAEHETFAAPGTNLGEAAADAGALREALERLPAGQRRALRLLKLEEMSLREAALASGKSVAALKVLTHRGLKRLRQLLGEGSPPK
ncbi:MAG: sigma-70 family RNA polymerase sigma factor [Betaproteobacteria bacterium]|nr:sigma-70 family RNA polymerase sigma factor [Betaproteobacteria bacterium]